MTLLSGPRPAVFLDRDGVINELVFKPDLGLVDSPLNADEFRLLPGVGKSIRLLNELGLLVLVVSNQPGIAKGKLTLAGLQAITDRMQDELNKVGAHVDGVYYCLHHSQSSLIEYRCACHCRKPRPGLLQRAAEEHDVDLAGSFMIGDDLTDVLAGRAAGCRTVFLAREKCALCRVLDDFDAHPDHFAADLAAAVEWIRQSLPASAASVQSG